MLLIKKIFFFFLFVFFISGLFWGVYYVSFKKPTAKESSFLDNLTPEEKEAQKKEIEIAKEKIAPVSEETVLFPTLSGNKIRFFSKEKETVREFDFYGKGSNDLSSQKFSRLEKISWSKDKNRAVIKVSDQNQNPVFYVQNFINGEIKPFKGNADEISWQNNADRLIYKYYDPKILERSLNVSDPDGTSWKKISEIKQRKISIAQAGKVGSVSFWNLPDAYEATNLTVVSLLGGESKTIFSGRFGADYLWSPQGDRALVSHTDIKGGYRIQLGMINSSGGEYKNLDVPTFVSKCVWSADGKFVYYALPGGIPQFSILPNDYDKKTFLSVDTFWKINVDTGEKSRIVETSDIKNSYDATQLFLNENESLLFFVNRSDGKLYRITF